MIRVKHRGNFNNIEQFLKKMARNNFIDYLNDCGKAGVNALASTTPSDTGLTAASWSYEIIKDKDGYTLSWSNSNVIKSGTPIVILLRYGHSTGTGGYVQGYDFINPSIRPIFDGFTTKVWNEVTSA